MTAAPLALSRDEIETLRAPSYIIDRSTTKCTWLSALDVDELCAQALAAHDWKERAEKLEAKNARLRENHADVVRRKRATAEKRDQFKTQRDAALKALERINRIASPSPFRTFDMAILDLDEITDIARAAIQVKR